MTKLTIKNLEYIVKTTKDETLRQMCLVELVRRKLMIAKATTKEAA